MYKWAVIKMRGAACGPVTPRQTRPGRVRRQSLAISFGDKKLDQIFGISQVLMCGFQRLSGLLFKYKSKFSHCSPTVSLALLSVHKN